MLNKFSYLLFLVIFSIFLPLKSSAAFDFGFNKRSYLHIVGSSTISPFMTAVSEEFARNQNLKNFTTKTPFVESSGTRVGFESFCGGVGLKYPDFVNASRPIERSEVAKCDANGVEKIVEIEIGYDGIVVGNSVRSKKLKLTKEQIFLALAEKIVDPKSKKLIANPYQKWSDIDRALPKSEILFYGPPLSSGTRDVFVDLVMEDTCFHQKEFVEIYKDDGAR